MKYGIVGSRRRTDKESVVAFINQLNGDDIVITGGSRGVDIWAEEAARGRGLEVKVIRPDTSGCKTRFEVADAYYERNRQIAFECEILIAFVSRDRKGGTENTISHAKRMGRPIRIMEER